MAENKRTGEKLVRAFQVGRLDTFRGDIDIDYAIHVTFRRLSGQHKDNALLGLPQNHFPHANGLEVPRQIHLFSAVYTVVIYT